MRKKLSFQAFNYVYQERFYSLYLRERPSDTYSDDDNQEDRRTDQGILHIALNTKRVKMVPGYLFPGPFLSDRKGRLIVNCEISFKNRSNVKMTQKVGVLGDI